MMERATKMTRLNVSLTVENLILFMSPVFRKIKHPADPFVQDIMINDTYSLCWKEFSIFTEKISLLN